jgi:hypothetical protein
MSFSASGVKAAWSLQNSQLGALSAILAPLASGALLDRGWAPAQLYFLFSGPFVIAAVAMLLIGGAPSRLTAALPGAGAVTGTGR